jgi:hypothetical protein
MNEEGFNTATRFAGDEANPQFEDLSPEFRDRSNADFFAEVRRRLDRAGKADPLFAHGGRGAIGLIGEYGWMGAALRGAQRHVRFDRLPSHWSHCFLFHDRIGKKASDNRSAQGSPWIWESTLEPASPFGRYLDRSGVAPRRLADYGRHRFDLFADHSVPNVAVVAFGMTEEDIDLVMDRADNPDVDRLRYDLLGLLGGWYAYLTSPATLPNPLTRGEALFSAAYLQLAYEAAGIDLALGSHQRNTSPEHIWQTGKYFHRPYEALGHPVRVYACIRDPYGGIPPAEVRIPRGLRGLISAAPKD